MRERGDENKNTISKLWRSHRVSQCRTVSCGVPLKSHTRNSVIVLYWNYFESPAVWHDHPVLWWLKQKKKNNNEKYKWINNRKSLLSSFSINLSGALRSFTHEYLISCEYFPLKWSQSFAIKWPIWYVDGASTSHHRTFKY